VNPIGQTTSLRDREQFAVVDFHPATERRGESRAVGHHNQDRLLFGLKFQQQISDRTGRGAVEIAGGFVG
jgi:hypothetical protein